MKRYITISRQAGSGGGEIGRLLAERLGYSYYDKERLREYAVERGLGKALLESYGEKNATSLLVSLSTGAFSFGYYNPEQSTSISQRVYLSAFETIVQVVKQGPCVVVGRCGNHILRHNPDSLHVFLHAPFAIRAAAIAERMDVSPREAEKYVEEQDRLRRSYYGYYTTGNWGDVGNCQISLDTSVLGVPATASLLAQIAASIPDEPQIPLPARHGSGRIQ